MRREMAEQVERYQVWGPAQLKAEVTRLDEEIKLAQHLKAAAMKAQRRQRKAAKTGGG